ncbi:hypothetical protein CANTEDRAFT_114209 [Yamadazyma tenuis ATCC 10573]|nr:uncharacterized protein CANTEDRAFT_114209 [Yamadazyma tenuis ATCC 10573]EGV64395.1 hypothetical protein CANTEDRAFT_114209 [Yamadazyma tenuis ATCC 10573]
MDYDTNISRHVPVFLERVFISIDKKYLLGHVAVKNLSFEKSVTMRYTFDNWGTIIEIPTIYVPDIPTVLRSNGYDRFVFKVQLNKMFNNFGANMHFQKNNYKFCIKYVANNTNYWDNNSMRDYEINLTKIITQANSPVARTNFSDNSVFNRTGSADSLTSLNSKGFKPRYSSSYLRRRSSDSKLSTLESDADYVKNNFYLSSPLLSNYSSGSFSSDVLNPSKSNTSTDTLIPNKNFLNPHDSNPLDLKSLNASLFTDNDNYNSPSYQQLIDNYCFFTPGGSQPQKSSSGSNQKESGNPSSSSSSGSNSASEPAGGLDGSSEFSSSTFTVSSLLGT